jgi:hypothetical protein
MYKRQLRAEQKLGTHLKQRYKQLKNLIQYFNLQILKFGLNVSKNSLASMVSRFKLSGYEIKLSDFPLMLDEKSKLYLLN